MSGRTIERRLQGIVTGLACYRFGSRATDHVGVVNDRFGQPADGDRVRAYGSTAASAQWGSLPWLSCRACPASRSSAQPQRVRNTADPRLSLQVNGRSLYGTRADRHHRWQRAVPHGRADRHAGACRRHPFRCAVGCAAARKAPRRRCGLPGQAWPQPCADPEPDSLSGQHLRDEGAGGAVPVVGVSRGLDARGDRTLAHGVARPVHRPDAQARGHLFR